MASKKKDWSTLLGTTPTAEDTDKDGTRGAAEPPTTVLMHTVVGNPANPRLDEDYTDADPEFRELKAAMKEIGQLQPVAVVSRTAYERAEPEIVAGLEPGLRDRFRAADWIVITGNRRLAAARQLGWTRIDIRVQDQLGDEGGRIDDAVIIENIHRKNLAPIKEAEFLKRMVDKYGSQDKVAERIGKSQMYVSHRLSLLKLAPEIQEQVDTRALKLKEARLLASRTDDHAEQRALVEEMKNGPAGAGRTRRGNTAVQNPVLKPPAEPIAGPPGAAAGVPAARSAGGAAERIADAEPQSAPVRPDSAPAYDDPAAIARQLDRTLDDHTLFEVLVLLARHARDRNPEAHRRLLDRLAEQPAR